MSISLISVGGSLQHPFSRFLTYGFPDGRGSSVPDLLRSLPRAQYASHDSGRKHALSSCLEGTRVVVLATIVSWLEGLEGQRRPIYWLSGLAGIGKSTIAKTVADRAKGMGMLGASFFFSRDDEPLRNPQLVFPTLAFQLAQSRDAFKKVIMKALKNDSTLGEKERLPQLLGLILEPLLKVNPKQQPVLIILDALDECEDRGAAEILRLLFSLVTRIPFLRILITSRPEPHISLVFDEELNHAKTVLHDIETSVIQEDIRLYLQTELAKIPRTLHLRMGANWASEDNIHSLVEKSGKLFIYAATSIRFISDDRVRDPRRQLHLILDLKNAQEAGATPYMQLDSLYMGVLHNSLSDLNRGDILKRFQMVVGSIILLREPLPLRSLAKFIPYEMGGIDAALYYLRSIIIPPWGEDEAPRIYHPSFRDFIMDCSRCSDPGFVIVAVPEQERRHAIRCLELLATFLKRDVAGISNPSLLNKEVDGFEGKVRDALLPEVRYACRYWATHLSCVELGDEVMVEALEKFSMQSILWWFEAMSLIGSVSAAISSIREAHNWAVSGCNCSSLDDLLIEQ
jgi:NACHT domain